MGDESLAGFAPRLGRLAAARFLLVTFRGFLFGFERPITHHPSLVTSLA